MKGAIVGSRTTQAAAAVLMLALPGCRSGQGPGAGAPVAPAAPGLVQQLVGQARILRHRGHEKKLTLRREELGRLGGGCDAAVEVRQAALEGGTLRLTLDHLGRPRVPGREAPARRGRRGCIPARQTTVAVSRIGGNDGLQAALAALLPTAEEYLRVHGAAADRAAQPPSGAAAADGPGTTNEERALARQVTAWAVPLLTVETDVARAKGIGVRESEVEFAAVVGADGLLYTPRVLTPLSAEHERQLLRVLSLWRYVPARAGERDLPSRITARTVLRLY